MLTNQYNNKHVTQEHLAQMSQPLSDLFASLYDIPATLWQNKSADQENLDFCQVICNRSVDIWLNSGVGWPRQVKLSKLVPKISGKGTRANESVDFAVPLENQKWAAVEVQLANSSRLDTDIQKFQVLYKEGVMELALWIVLTEEAAKRADAGLATFEKAIQKADELNFPVIIVGLAIDPDNTLDLSKIPGLTLSEVVGGKGGIGSQAVQQEIAEQLLLHRDPCQVKLSPASLKVIRAAESSALAKMSRRLNKSTLMARNSTDPDTLRNLKAQLLEALHLLDSYASGSGGSPVDLSA